MINPTEVMRVLTVKNKSDVAELYLSGDIVDDTDGGMVANMTGGDTTGYEFPAKLKAQLDGIEEDKPIEMHINSVGGSVFAGVALANMIARHKGKTTCIIDGLAASIATQIFFSADVCKMPSNCYLMLHRPFTATQGNAEELRKAADVLDTLQAGLETTYQRKAREGVTSEEIHAMVNAETWLTGEIAADKFQIKLLNPVKTLNAAGNVAKLKALGIEKIPLALNFLGEPSDDSTARKKIKIIMELTKGLL